MDGPNAGFRFVGSGALVYRQIAVDAVCTYGGLTYAYRADEVRIWRPTNITNGGIICIANDLAYGTNAQSSTEAYIMLNLRTVRQMPFYSSKQTRHI